MKIIDNRSEIKTDLVGLRITAHYESIYSRGDLLECISNYSYIYDIVIDNGNIIVCDKE